MTTTTRLAVKVTPDGRTERLDLGADAYPVLSGAVEGLIEPVTLTADLEFYVNEDGWAQFGGAHRNPTAEAAQWAILGGANLIVGPAVFTGGLDEEGETLGLSEEHAQQIEQLAAAVRGAA
ncbi:DUF3846 domain-containing protein [Microbacterium paludicola]|uniref:DUF3846 domain-containing protein n=2 Tax=Microbacterium paludicola TaxID=300019 RepID=A0A4Y9FKS1_9MICO|nr:DUF3846 domain-containing protein [Microbacterium paludicola]MBF0817791.1 DUF3846 domain-containing protein [Microbacterium paludicola]TFU29784.1 DUF3846 domain-containing protein [Microbacterium paludicola]